MSHSARWSYYRSPRVSTATWQDLLADATATHDVLEVVRDYLATLAPHDIAALPERCRPNRLWDADDVALYADKLVKHGCDAGKGNAEMQRLTVFFAAASQCISRIMASARDEQPRFHSSGAEQLASAALQATISARG